MMEQFRWPKGTQSELRIYSTDYPQRAPTEEYFGNKVRHEINNVRNGVYYNLWLLIESLRDSEGKSDGAGFDTWFWAITGVLGSDTCNRIGKQVCSEVGFTISEGERLMEDYRQQTAKKLGLPPESTWEVISKERSKLKGY